MLISKNFGEPIHSRSSYKGKIIKLQDVNLVNLRKPKSIPHSDISINVSMNV